MTDTVVLARFELVSLIIQHHIQLLKRRLRDTDDSQELISAPIDIVGAVIAPEILTHMIALDLHIDYDDALEILRTDEAMWYSDVVEKEYLHHRLRGMPLIFEEDGLERNSSKGRKTRGARA